MSAFIDPRIQARRCVYTPVVRARWELISAHMITDPEGNGGRHHVYVTTLDENAKPISGVPIRFWWQDGEVIKIGNVRDDGGIIVCADFPMHAGGNSYGAAVYDGESESLWGMGLGIPAKPVSGEHVSYRLIFKRRVADATPPVVAPPPEPPTPPDDDLLALLESVAFKAAEVATLAQRARELAR